MTRESGANRVVLDSAGFQILSQSRFSNEVESDILVVVLVANVDASRRAVLPAAPPSSPVRVLVATVVVVVVVIA